MSTPCQACSSERTIPLGKGVFCLDCGGSDAAVHSFEDIRPDLAERLRAPSDDEDAEKLIIEMLEDVWSTAYTAGALVAAKSVHSEILSRPGRLKRLRGLWPLTTETEAEFRELLFFGAAE